MRQGNREQEDNMRQRQYEYEPIMRRMG